MRHFVLQPAVFCPKRWVQLIEVRTVLSLSDPFQRYPRVLARLPRIMRLFILNGFLGFVIAGVFTALILHYNIANIGYLVARVEGGWLACAVFFVFNGVVFGGVQTAIVVMSLPYPGQEPPGGRKERLSQPVEVAIPVRVAHRPAGKPVRDEEFRR